VGVCFNYSNTQILDDKLDSVTSGNNAFNIFCYNLEYLKDFSGCSGASASDNTATTERSKQRHQDKRAQM